MSLYPRLSGRSPRCLSVQVIDWLLVRIQFSLGQIPNYRTVEFVFLAPGVCQWGISLHFFLVNLLIKQEHWNFFMFCDEIIHSNQISFFFNQL